MGEADAGVEVDIRRYAKALERRKFTVLVVTGIMVLAALLLSLIQSRVYSADAQVLVQPTGNDVLFQNGPPETVDPTLELGTDIKVLESKPLQTEVEHRIGKVAKVSVRRDTDTLILDVTGQASTAPRAALVANTYAQAFIDQRQAQAAASSADAVRTLQDKVADLQRQIDAVDARLAQAGLGSAVASALGAQRSSLSTQQGVFRQQLDQLEVQTTVSGSGARIVARATPPHGPSQPRVLRNLLLALIAGLVLGVTVAFVREYMDDSIRTTDDVDDVAGGLPLIGTVPAVTAWQRDPTAPRLATASDAMPAAEAFRSIRTSLQLLNVEVQPTVIQMTSPAAGEGKTTATCNLALAFAEAGQRVVVVDLDLRRPRVDAVFGLSPGVGFTTVMARESELATTVRRVPGEDRLFVLPAGPPPPNPSELLASRKTSELIYTLQSTYDMVIIDSAPVLPVTDAVVLSAWVDATVLVVAADKTTKRGVTGALRILGQSDAPLVGIVLNQAGPDATYGYGYGYGYGDRPTAGPSAAPGGGGNGQLATRPPGGEHRATHRLG